jgi:hypothetical protein
MKTRLYVLGLVVATGASSSGNVLACGDKFLMPSRGTRYERSANARQASAVLIYASPASQLSRTLTMLSVEPVLLKAGYKPTTVRSESELAMAVRERAYDLVVVDGNDTQTVGRVLQGAALPHVVPVMYKPTKTDLTQARKLYRIVIYDPGRSRAFIDTIDDAMDLREAEAKAAAKKAAR